MKENRTNNPQNVSQQLENSLETLILYRSLYIIKQKFSSYKDKLKNIYTKYNIDNIDKNLIDQNYNSYQINKKDFVSVTTEILKEINLIIIKFLNPKEIFISGVLIENKIKEMTSIIENIYNCLQKGENNFSIEYYNNIFYNKKILPNLKTNNNTTNNAQNINTYIQINIESNDQKISNEKNNKKNNKKSEKNSQQKYVKVVGYDRKGRIIDKYETRVFEEDEDNIDNNILKKYNNNPIINKELSININNSASSKSSNYSNYINNDCLYIESLPLILADFLQLYKTYAIIESEDELSKEIKILFDKDLLKRINEYENVDKIKIISDNTNNKNLNQALHEIKKLKENIKLYKDILENKRKLNEDADYIEKMIEKLLSKEIWLEQRIKLLENKNNNKYDLKNNIISGNTGLSGVSSIIRTEPKFYNNNFNKNKKSDYIANKTMNTIISNENNRTNTFINTNNNNKKNVTSAIKEIFLFYSKQHNLVGNTPLFSNIEEKKNVLDLIEFSKFCTDFKLPIPRQKLLEIFKKNTSNFKTLTYNEFSSILNVLANAMHESKKNSITETITHRKNLLNSIQFKEKQLKEENQLKKLLNNTAENENNKKNNSRSKSGKNANFLNQKKLINNDISINKIGYNKENSKTEQEIIEDFYKFLGLYNTQDYRSKMRGNSRDLIKIRERNTSGGERNRSFKREEFGQASKYSINLNNLKEKEKEKANKINEEQRKKLLYEEKVKLFNINKQKLALIAEKKLKEKNYIDILQEKKQNEENNKYNKYLKQMQKNRGKNNSAKIINRRLQGNNNNIKINNLENSLGQNNTTENNEIKKIKNLLSNKFKEKEKIDTKNKISWNKLENFDINDLGMKDEDKEIFNDSDNSDNEFEKFSKNENSRNNSFHPFNVDSSVIKKNKSNSDFINEETNSKNLSSNGLLSSNVSNKEFNIKSNKNKKQGNFKDVIRYKKNDISPIKKIPTNEFGN